MTNIKILTGSNRPGRFGIQPAEWIFELAKKRSDISVELIDVEKLNLPFLDEPVPPLMQQYSKTHTKDWSKKIHEADGFIFVTPEYNHSVSAVLKNAVDFLAHEWYHKPLAMIGYGAQAGGSRAVEHWRQIAGQLKMFDLNEHLLLPNYWEHLNEEGKYQFSEIQEKQANDMLDALIFWATDMKAARAKLQKKS
jgi:NAD(P)H-dependent FMN reductase